MKHQASLFGHFLLAFFAGYFQHQDIVTSLVCAIMAGVFSSIFLPDPAPPETPNQGT